jgi:hypothetical protein
METLNRNDQRALKRAFVAAQSESTEERMRLDEIVRTRGWLAAARDAAYTCQVRNLKPRPWQRPPCEIAPDAQVSYPPSYGHSPAEIGLMRRMLALGVSRFEPDPAAALERAEAIKDGPARG